jgi:D-glycero-D-manno-heptose 1,7-bisphosphate phosphatase
MALPRVASPAADPKNHVVTNCLAKAVFLDRDGVLVVPEFRDGRSFAPRSLDAFHLYSDAKEAVRALKDEGFIVIVVTNQPDVGAGVVDVSTAEAMHARLRAELDVDDVEVCYETRQQASLRRKPEPGMLLDAARKWNLDLPGSYMVGDRASDIEAAKRAGCTGIFIDFGYSAEPQPITQAVTVVSLALAAEWILAKERERRNDRTAR